MALWLPWTTCGSLHLPWTYLWLSTYSLELPVALYGSTGTTCGSLRLPWDCLQLFIDYLYQWWGRPFAWITLGGQWWGGCWDHPVPNHWFLSSLLTSTTSCPQEPGNDPACLATPHVGSLGNRQETGKRNRNICDVWKGDAWFNLMGNSFSFLLLMLMTGECL